MSASMLITKRGKDCYTKRPVVTKDSGGSPVSVFTTSLISFKADIQPRSGNEGVRYGRENNRYDYKAFALVGLDIQEQDRLHCGDRVYDVQFVWNRDGATDPCGHMVIGLEETKP